MIVPRFELIVRHVVLRSDNKLLVQEERELSYSQPSRGHDMFSQFREFMTMMHAPMTDNIGRNAANMMQPRMHGSARNIERLCDTHHDQHNTAQQRGPPMLMDIDATEDTPPPAKSPSPSPRHVLHSSSGGNVAPRPTGLRRRTFVQSEGAQSSCSKPVIVPSFDEYLDASMNSPMMLEDDHGPNPESMDTPKPESMDTRPSAHQYEDAAYNALLALKKSKGTAKRSFRITGKWSPQAVMQRNKKIIDKKAGRVTNTGQGTSRGKRNTGRGRGADRAKQPSVYEPPATIEWDSERDDAKSRNVYQCFWYDRTKRALKAAGVSDEFRKTELKRIYMLAGVVFDTHA